MINLLNLTRWEWFKLRRRRMPWVLLAILVLFSQLAVWGGYLAYSTLAASGGQAVVPGGANPVARGPRMRTVACEALRADPAAVLPEQASEEAIAALLAQCQQRAGRLEGQFAALTPAGSVSTALGVASTIGLILFAVLSASTIGSEYGLGTLRPILIKGPGRLSFLASKLAIVIAAAAGALLVVAVAAAASGWIAQGMAEPPPGAVVPRNDWIDAGITLAKTWLAFIPYIGFAAALTVLTRSTAAGMAISLGYYFTEGILVALLSALFDWFEQVADYLLIRNINAFTGGGFSIGPGGGGLAGGGLAGEAGAPGVVLLVYLLAFAGFTVWVFLRRDVAGASSG